MKNGYSGVQAIESRAPKKKEKLNVIKGISFEFPTLDFFQQRDCNWFCQESYSDGKFSISYIIGTTKELGGRKGPMILNFHILSPLYIERKYHSFRENWKKKKKREIKHFLSLALLHPPHKKPGYRFV